MIRLLIRIPIALVVVLALAWGWVLGLAGEPDRILRDGLGRLTEAYPRPGVRERVLLQAEKLSGKVWRTLAGFGGLRTPAGRAGVLVAALHAVALRRVLPLYLLHLAAGTVAGLVLRERMRDGKGYASPTAAGLGRMLSGGGILWLGLFSLSPVGGSYAFLYVAFLGSALGGALYVANLPLKI
ncbi:MAG TPA: hypothetical protein VMU54_21665 [Planctomycetota bacterium]|nr:hypothetical protein [Planctomycetota bacterium]